MPSWPAQELRAARRARHYVRERFGVLWWRCRPVPRLSNLPVAGWQDKRNLERART